MSPTLYNAAVKLVDYIWWRGGKIFVRESDYKLWWRELGIPRFRVEAAFEELLRQNRIAMRVAGGMQVVELQRARTR